MGLGSENYVPYESSFPSSQERVTRVYYYVLYYYVPNSALGHMYLVVAHVFGHDTRRVIGWENSDTDN